MFRYSSVEIYTTCKPQPTLQFVNPIRQDWFEGQRRNVWFILLTVFCTLLIFSSCTTVPDAYAPSFKVHAKGMAVYSEVSRFLQNLKNEHPDAITLAINCGLALPVKDFTELEELLIKEKAQFEVGICILLSLYLFCLLLLIDFLFLLSVLCCRVLWTRPLIKMGYHPRLCMNS